MPRSAFQANQCQRTSMLTYRVEDAIEAAYQHVGLDQRDAVKVKNVLGGVFDTLEAPSDDERQSLTVQKNKLEAEELKLLQAHYADAISLDLLKTEQDRIRASLTTINTRLSKLDSLYDGARDGLDAVLDILTDLGDLYTKAQPPERRMLNRALLTRITIDDEEKVTIEAAEPVATILDTAAKTKNGNARTSSRIEAGQGSNVADYVELRGIEPLTFSLRTKRSTN